MEKIALMGTKGKSVVWIKRHDYQKFYETILSEVKANSSLFLAELIERVSAKLYTEFPRNFSWILLQVKHDMEARGLIKTNVDPLKQQTIWLSVEGRATIL
jgi:hypothetical protein